MDTVVLRTERERSAAPQYTVRKASKAAALRALLATAPILALIGWSFFFAQTDPDYWWHARTGQYILETGRLPQTDIYSFAAANTRWIAHEWLTEVILYATGHWLGYAANAALFGALGIAIALIVRATCRRRGCGAGEATLLMLWGFAMLLPLANVRPQMITVLALALCAFILTLYRQGNRRALLGLPPLFALWVNLHGGYVIGLVLLGLTLLGEGLEWWTAGGGSARQALRAMRPLFLVSVLAGLATALTPHGLEAIRYPLSYFTTNNASLRYVAEWQSPDFHQAMFLPFAAALVLALLLGIWQRPLGPTEALWVCCFAYLGLQSSRHIPLFAVVAVPLLGSRLHATLATWRWPRALARWREPGRRMLLAFGVILPLIAILTPLTTPSLRQQLQLGSAPNAQGYPHGAVDYLLAHAADAALQGHLFNEYRWAGYLIYRLYPARQVFISAQGTDPYGDQLFAAYRRASRLEPGWRTALDDWQIDLVLVDKDGPLATALRDDPGWRELYAGDVERLFARRAGAP
jgi:hypothetical protein